MTRKDAKFQVSLTAPNCNATTLRKFHYQFWIFLEAITKDKKLNCKSIAQNLEQDLLTRRLFSFGNGG